MIVEESDRRRKTYHAKMGFFVISKIGENSVSGKSSTIKRARNPLVMFIKRVVRENKLESKIY